MKITKEVQARIDLMRKMRNTELAVARLWEEDALKTKDAEEKAAFLQHAVRCRNEAWVLEDCIALFESEDEFKAMANVYSMK